MKQEVVDLEEEVVQDLDYLAVYMALLEDLSLQDEAFYSWLYHLPYLAWSGRVTDNECMPKKEKNFRNPN